MNSMFFFGVILALLMVPRILAALSDGRSPRIAIFVMVVGLVMAAIPILQDPGHYKPSTFAMMVIDKVGQVIND